jgi:hypothetical protein
MPGGPVGGDELVLVSRIGPPRARRGSAAEVEAFVRELRASLPS